MPKLRIDRDRLLRTFIAVARAGSLQGAAYVIGVTPAAVSRQVSALEEWLGAQLFVRHGRGMRLTALGSELLERTGQGFDLVDAALAQAGSPSSSPTGLVGIATVNTLGAYLMPEVVGRIRALWPQRVVQLWNASSPDVVEHVARGTADLGVVYDLAVDTNAVELSRLHMENVCLYCRDDARFAQAVELSALRHQPFIVPPQRYALRRLLDRTFVAGLNAAIECNSVSVSLDLVQRGLGVVVLPDCLPTAMIEARGLRRVRLAGVDLRRRVVLIHRRRRAALPPAVREAIDIVRQCATVWDAAKD